MKEVFLNHSMNFIINNRKGLTEEEKEKLSYGLEGIYMNITKLAIIFLVALLLNIIKEFLITLVLFNIIRFLGFGFHASKSIACLSCSAILIVGFPYLFTTFEISLTLKIILCCVSVIAFILYAPADTEKRPLTNKKKRIIRKVAASCLAGIYSIIVIAFDGNLISNLFLAALMIETVFILPIIYKIFGESYNNYKKV